MYAADVRLNNATGALIMLEPAIIVRAVVEMSDMSKPSLY
jgi:hypothetical protein